jgi:hypothetical protein
LWKQSGSTGTAGKSSLASERTLDRYANFEIAYRLERMAHREGVVILATNLAKRIDEAFIRPAKAEISKGRRKKGKPLRSVPSALAAAYHLRPTALLPLAGSTRPGLA